ncbi:hypothetical protein [Citrobacter sp. Marseille-Q6884]|uniref:hypothetical protein n=1 Tax=Citrobacter sp. Marseille-Q6884 TaxID=2956786 RepID=UPI0021B2C71F|nr:hypothetical protein [Citrobacter sp. Marseille-Q6884]
MENDITLATADGAEIIELVLFSLQDPDFLTKYSTLSALWAKLIQLKIVTIAIDNNNVVLRLFTYESDSDVILNTYLDEVRNVFACI